MDLVSIQMTVWNVLCKATPQRRRPDIFLKRYYLWGIAVHCTLGGYLRSGFGVETVVPP